MNRLSPWIVRHPRRAFAAAAPSFAPPPAAEAAPAEWLDDLRLFLTGWIGGLVFFGTLIG